MSPITVLAVIVSYFAVLFLISQSIGASLRLFVVPGVLHLALFQHYQIPLMVTVCLTILLIYDVAFYLFTTYNPSSSPPFDIYILVGQNLWGKFVLNYCYIPTQILKFPDCASKLEKIFREFEPDDQLPPLELRLKAKRQEDTKIEYYRYYMTDPKKDDMIIASTRIIFSTPEDPGYEKNKKLTAISTSVLPEYRGKGFAKKLIKIALQKAVDRKTVEQIGKLFFHHHLYRSEDVYILSGDECVVAKFGKFSCHW